MISGQAVRIYSTQTYAGIDAPIVRAYSVVRAIVVNWNVMTVLSSDLCKLESRTYNSDLINKSLLF